MVKRNFKVRSLEALGTLDQDIDMGVIRVTAEDLKELGSRNSLVRVSTMWGGLKQKSLIRIVRGATGTHALLKDEVALQYDDRVELGIFKVGGNQMLSIESVNQWTVLPCFLLGHTSPLVRANALFSIALMAVGVFLGFILGLLLTLKM